MNKNIKFVDYRRDSFVDYAGQTHIIVVCGIVTELVDGDSSYRSLCIGVAMCNPIDKNKVQLGEQIAYGKALKCRDGNALVGRPGLLNKKLVAAILDNEAEHVKQCPWQYSKAYKAAEEKYMKEHSETV